MTKTTHHYQFEDSFDNTDAQAIFDQAVAAITAGTARPQKLSDGYSLGFRFDSSSVSTSAVLRYALFRIPSSEFDAAKAWDFIESCRKLLGWEQIQSVLDEWVESRLRDPYFVNHGDDWFNEKWELNPEVDTSGLPTSFYDFACRIAIGHLKFGPSYASVTAQRIFDWVTSMGSPLPAQLKHRGSGTLPSELSQLSASGMYATANDVIATIHITLEEESEDTYRHALQYLIRVLTETDFPKSYCIDFQGPTQIFLPIHGLPHNGANQLFAGAVAYPALHSLIADYAVAAMQMDNWYSDLEAEDCAMPGTFAVFALGLIDDGYHELVARYLTFVDGEHQELHSRFVAAYIDKYGFSPLALHYFVLCAGNIQQMQPQETYPALIANEASLQALANIRHSGMLQDNGKPKKIHKYHWQEVCFGLWGEDGVNNPDTIISAAPMKLQPLYQAILK